MEKVLTVEVNLNLKADESLQKIVAYIFGQKLSSQNEQLQPVVAPQPAAAPQPAVDVDPDPQPDEAEAKPKRTRSKKADPKPQPTEQPVEQPTEQPVEQPTEQPTEQPAPAEEVSLEEIKQVFFTKLAGHRDEIRAKINELGAPSLSLIAPEKRSEMLEFLKGLD